MAPPDRRITPWREDLAAAHLEGQLSALRYAEAMPMWVNVPVADLHATPQAGPLASQLIFGEAFDVYEIAGGLAWGQSRSDDYVGYVEHDQLTAAVPVSPVTVTARATHLYPRPDIKTTPSLNLPRGARLPSRGSDGDFVQTDIGYLPRIHTVDRPFTDPVAAAEDLLGVPYLWGGRSSFGLDCSGLVQVMMTAAGRPCPRDSDMQAALGEAAGNAPMRGDLVFWRGHVGIMQSEDQILHANAHTMDVTSEALGEAEARIAATETGPVTARRRVL